MEFVIIHLYISSSQRLKFNVESILRRSYGYLLSIRLRKVTAQSVKYYGKCFNILLSNLQIWHENLRLVKVKVVYLITTATTTTFAQITLFGNFVHAKKEIEYEVVNSNQTKFLKIVTTFYSCHKLTTSLKKQVDEVRLIILLPEEHIVVLLVENLCLVFDYLTKILF